jgi:poly-beta-1,6-N-acetyl-D-glucosamine synthase
MLHLLYKVIFFCSLLLLLNSYLFYPLFIWIISKIKKPFIKVNNNFPNISLIISAYNEEKVIEETIQNILLSDYPISQIEIVIGSDNSTDSTNEIVRKLADMHHNIKFIEFNKRRGKSKVLNDLVKEASHDILVFADANTIYYKDALKNLSKYFEDSSVGGVSGRLILKNLDNSESPDNKEKIYWDMETWLKIWEGKIGILIGANGGIYAIRKKLFSEIPTTHPVTDDFYISLKVLEQGKKFIYAKDAAAEEFISPSMVVEFNRKIRNNAINLSTIKSLKNMMLPAFGLISFAFWSHKIIRWFTPVLIILLYLSNLLLLDYGIFYKIFFALQNLFLFCALLGYLLKKIKINVSFLLLCSYFVMTNLAMLVGIYRFIFNKQTAFWQSTLRN